MIRTSRTSFAPLALLVAFEIGAILLLQKLGSSASMQVQWSDFASWLNANPLETTVPALVRIVALVVAYWMFLSTALFLCAQISRIPGAVRATSWFTLPSVRRVVDASMAVSIATTAVVGVGGTAAMAAPAPVTQSVTQGPDGKITFDSISTSSTLGSPATSISVDTGASAIATPGVASSNSQTSQAPIGSDASSDTAASGTAADDTGSDEGVAQTPSSSTTQAPTTTSSSTTAAPAPAATSGALIINGSSNSGSVATPRPAAPLQQGTDAANQAAGNNTAPSTSAAPSTSQAPTTSQAPATWVIPSGSFAVSTPKPSAAASSDSTAPFTGSQAAPSTSTPAPSTSGDAQVLGVQEHRVAKGENLWTISRDALMQANGGKAPTETQVRDYWLKVIDANRDNLRSKDPHWIFAGEVVTLPAQ